jgi:hypothetical protein
VEDVGAVVGDLAADLEAGELPTRQWTPQLVTRWWWWA